MSESPAQIPRKCPNCQKDIPAGCDVCSDCTNRESSPQGAAMRGLVWLGILIGYCIAVGVSANFDPNIGATVGMVLGLPLAYSFVKALFFRVLGRPLTLQELRATTFRATLVSIIVLVVVPIIIVIACVILLLAMCASSGVIGR